MASVRKERDPYNVGCVVEREGGCVQLDRRELRREEGWLGPRGREDDIALDLVAPGVPTGRFLSGKELQAR